LFDGKRTAAWWTFLPTSEAAAHFKAQSQILLLGFRTFLVRTLKLGIQFLQGGAP